MAIENRIRSGGMLNLGNTGYLEVVLQTLYHCADFRSLVLSLNLDKLHPEPGTSNHQDLQLVKELQNMFRTLKQLEKILPPAEDPAETVQHEVLRQVYSHINPYIGPLGHADPDPFVKALKRCIRLRNPIDEANDSHDFYATFLRKLRQFIGSNARWLEPTDAYSKFKRIFISGLTRVKICARCQQYIPGSSDRSCSGSHVGSCYDCPVSCAMQDPHSRTGQEVPPHLTPHILRAFSQGVGRFDGSGGSFHMLSLQSGQRCDCSPMEDVPVFVRRRQIFTSEQMPTILACRFVRWPMVNRNVYFEFEQHLDFTRFMEGKSRESGSLLLYRLLSVIVHHGNTNGYGLYLSFVRSGNQWGKFWGTQVQPVSWETVQKESFGGHNGGHPCEEKSNVGYMLFYERAESIS